MKNPDLNCDKCQKVIEYSEEHLSISKNIESAEWVESRNRIEIEVIDSLQLLTLCDTCQKGFDTCDLAKMIIMVQDNKE